jgi:hypothetical protein
LCNNIIRNIQIPHELVHLLTDVSTRLPTAFEATIKTMVANSITTIHNKSATLAFIIATHGIEPNPPTWSVFTLSG